MSRAILFAVAGTSSDQAAAAFRNIDRLTAVRFPGVARYWAYTSRGVRRKLAALGRPVDDPVQALARMRADGVTQLVVQSLHMVMGMEYDDLRHDVAAFNAGPEGFEQCIVGSPILETKGLFGAIVEKLMVAAEIPFTDGTALLLVAHGSRRAAARAAYEQAATYCHGLDGHVLLGTIMPPRELPTVLAECRQHGIRRVVAVPFTIAAGSSATEDMAGTHSGSWRSALEREGIECTPVLRGLGENDSIVALWLDRVEQMAGELTSREARGMQEANSDA